VVLPHGHATLAGPSGGFHHGAGRVAAASAVYRPRHPERTPSYQLFERYFDRHLTFGSYANWHPRLYVSTTHGVVTRDGQKLGPPHWTPQVVEEFFLRMVLTRLAQAEQLSEEFQRTLLGWVHSGLRCAASGWSGGRKPSPWNVSPARR
jgi:hypothetical protein